MEDEDKCKICGSNIVGVTIMPEFNWKRSYHCENGHWYIEQLYLVII